MTVDADDYGPAARRRHRAERAGLVETAPLEPAVASTHRPVATRLRLVELTIALLLTATAATFGAIGWIREALGVGFAGQLVMIVWAAAVIVDRIETTPIVLQDPPIADQYRETY